MIYQEGGKIISKKQHACGGREWQIVRTGADIKLKCLTCGRIVFFSVVQVKKMAKSYQPSSNNEDN